MSGRTGLRPKISALACLALACFGPGACQKKPPQPDPADIQAARHAALTLDVKLRQDLLSRLDREEDPVAVYMAYRDHIDEMTREASGREKLDLSRVALRVRNPANRADEWEATQLELFQAYAEMGMDIANMETAEVVTENKKQVFRWIKPLQVEDSCMTCHGDAIDDRILALLRQDYAEDDATGYYAYEMLGAWSVSKPLGDSQ
jgi:Protein of unknown function (DUF3365)